DQIAQTEDLERITRAKASRIRAVALPPMILHSDNSSREGAAVLPIDLVHPGKPDVLSAEELDRERDVVFIELAVAVEPLLLRQPCHREIADKQILRDVGIVHPSKRVIEVLRLIQRHKAHQLTFPAVSHR